MLLLRRKKRCRKLKEEGDGTSDTSTNDTSLERWSTAGRFVRRSGVAGSRRSSRRTRLGGSSRIGSIGSRGRGGSRGSYIVVGCTRSSTDNGKVRRVSGLSVITLEDENIWWWAISLYNFCNHGICNLQEGLVSTVAGMFQVYWGGLTGIGAERILAV